MAEIAADGRWRWPNQRQRDGVRVTAKLIFFFKDDLGDGE